MLINVAALAAFIGAANAFPKDASVLDTLELSKRQTPDGYGSLAHRLPPYLAPGPYDSRGPCPALNTLANHQLINHDGMAIRPKDLINGFARGFGIDESAITIAINNFLTVCQYVNNDEPCVDDYGNHILFNLTLLAEPHAFEHDHSFSRQDFREAYANGLTTDNIYFNSTEFQTSLDVLDYVPSNPPTVILADYQDFNQIRLQRESIQNTNDFPGWFQQNIPVQLFEVGFIFGATFDRDEYGNMIGDVPMVRVDWWNFWFSEESFPTQLGWVPASTQVFDFDFVTSVSDAVLRQPITSTPANLPAGATVTTTNAVGPLPSPSDPSPVLPLFISAPYAAPVNPSNIHAATPVQYPTTTTGAHAATTHFTGPCDHQHTGNGINKRQHELEDLAHAGPAIVSATVSVIGPAPPKYDFYRDEINVASVVAQVAAAQAHGSAVVSVVHSLL